MYQMLNFFFSLLRESRLISFPPHSDMLKFCGSMILNHIVLRYQDYRSIQFTKEYCIVETVKSQLRDFLLIPQKKERTQFDLETMFTYYSYETAFSSSYFPQPSIPPRQTG